MKDLSVTKKAKTEEICKEKIMFHNPVSMMEMKEWRNNKFKT